MHDVGGGHKTALLFEVASYTYILLANIAMIY